MALRHRIRTTRCYVQIKRGTGVSELTFDTRLRDVCASLRGVLRHLRPFANARQLHGCRELNELTDLADFLLERLSG